MAKLNKSYQLWHNFLTKLPRHTRFTLGNKIDNLFTDCLELGVLAEYAPKEKKPELAEKISEKIDILKFFLKLLWELKALDTKKYTTISILINEAGKMTGGWLKSLKN